MVMEKYNKKFLRLYLFFEKGKGGERKGEKD